MLNTSSIFNEEMKSNVRQRLEPHISVQGIDARGESVSLYWTPSNIKSLTFTRNIDPTGNSLPSMELKWTEVYDGKLNAQSQPFKYENVLAQMTVDLMWTLNSKDSFTWREVSELTWYDLAQDGRIWADLSSTKEIVRFPRLFLTSQPTIKDNTITWIAVDILSFFNQKWVKYFNGTENPTTIKNVVLYGLTEARATFWNNIDLRSLIQTSILNIKNSEWDSEIGLPILCDGILKEQFSHACAIDDAFLDFEKDGSLKISRLTDREKVFDFSANIMPSFPQITQLGDIYQYSWTQKVFEPNAEKKYGKFAKSTNEVLGVSVDKYIFDGYGQADDDELSEINYALTVAKTEGSKIITVIPIVENEYEFDLVDNFIQNGDSVKEENPLFPYSESYAHPTWRFNYLKSLSNRRLSILDFTTIGNIAVETGDRVGVETNLYDENDNRIIKEGFVFDIKIEYNGVVKEKIKVNEFEGWLDA